MPAWATRVTQERWSAGIARNQDRTSSIRATAWVANDPDARSSRRRVASDGGRLLTRLTRSACHAGRGWGRVDR